MNILIWTPSPPPPPPAPHNQVPLFWEGCVWGMGAGQNLFVYCGRCAWIDISLYMDPLINGRGLGSKLRVPAVGPPMRPCR